MQENTVSYEITLRNDRKLFLRISLVYNRARRVDYTQLPAHADGHAHPYDPDMRMKSPNGSFTFQWPLTSREHCTRACSVGSAALYIP